MMSIIKYLFIFTISILSFLSTQCSAPPSEVEASSSNSPESMSDEALPRLTGDPAIDNAIEEKEVRSAPDVLPQGWTLRSPDSSSTSSDPAPVLYGTKISDYGSGTAELFLDAECKNKVAESTISSEGDTVFKGLRFKDDGSEDGIKKFYIKAANSKRSSACMDHDINYTLRTDIPRAKSSLYRLTIQDDPSRTISVGFNASSNSLSDSKVYYDVDDHGRDVQSYAFSKSIDVNRSYLDMNNAFAKLSKLKPDTRYYFVIQDGAGVSPTFSFETLPDNPDTPLSIITGGDSRDNRSPRKSANLLVSKLKPHVVFFGGDMTSSGSPSQWKEWFEDWQATISPEGHMTAVIAARGNHESENAVLENLFNSPSNAYYAVNLGGNLMRAYTLNSETSISGTQTEWLTNDLINNRNEIWRMVQYHRPMRPHVAGKEVANDLYDAWAQLFETYRMDVAIESDSHVVKTTWPIRKSNGSSSKEGFKRDDKEGTVFLGEGGWGAPLRKVTATKEWTRDSGSFNHFNWLKVEKEKIEIRTIKVDNASSVGTFDLKDRFKTPDGLDIWSPSNGPVITIKRNP
jgi:hypothetical protein